MKRQLVPFFVTLFLLTVGLVFSQGTPRPPQQTPPGMPSLSKMMKSPMGQISQTAGVKAAFRSIWNGQSGVMSMGLLQQPEFREGIGMTEQQFSTMQTGMMSRMMQSPEMREASAGMATVMNPMDPFFENASPETLQKLAKVQENIINVSMEQMSQHFNESLTPEQRQRMNEVQIAMMSEVPFLGTSQYDAFLGLSDEQKTKMESIRKDFEGEFEKMIDDIAEFAKEFTPKMFDMMEKEGIPLTAMAPNPANMGQNSEIQKKMQEVVKKVMQENKEFVEKGKDFEAKTKAFSARLKVKIFDVLTDEQMAKLKNLIDNPPEFVKKMKERQKREKAAMEGDGESVWQPGIDSWKPGDAIPAGYLEEREQRKPFPTKED